MFQQSPPKGRSFGSSIYGNSVGPTLTSNSLFHSSP